MTARTSERRRAAFFAALAETGNQTLAAERAKVSRSWVTLHRAGDPAFKAEMDAAVAAAKGRLDQATGVGPARRWATQDGEELAVRGSNGRWTQVARARVKQWTPRAEERFLQALARCCNVKRACAVVGLSPASAYNHRRRWHDFARRWDEAIEDGYDELAMSIAASVGAALGDRDMAPELVMPPISLDEALQALRLHKARVLGVGRAPGRWRRPRSLEELSESILAKFEAIERMRDAERRGASDGG
ncbi:hypothetical protein [Sphingomonas lenta]|uniref:Terminase n=1 Tax=Sphingomonas lenta TaxID=1141887 RepID=A0A2A2SCY7_9SPHN|nr:hypothetical protein [Sphingomonas lenta]PAX07118.1 hypothetical protein CKY28_13825 [Sphingomonas lenta]